MLKVTLLCSSKISNCLDRLSSGNSGLLKSQAIWKSALDNTSPIALYLIKICDYAIRIFAQCTSSAVRRQLALAELCGQIFKCVTKIVDQVSAVFGSDAHLLQDFGMKRSLMERYCNLVLEKHIPMLGSPPQFKVLWQTLCSIATRFSATSFDSAALCLRVYLKSSETVRTLALQTVSLLNKAKAEEIRDPKIARKLKGPMAFIRFVVFQMPTLVNRILGKETGGAAETNPHWRSIVSGAMLMLDTVFGHLTAPSVLVRASDDIASTLQTLVVAACTKFALAIMLHSTEPIARYLEKLSAFLQTVDQNCETGFCSRIPLIEGLGQSDANREVLRVALENIGFFTLDQQSYLLEATSEKASIVQAFVLAVDRDPVSVLLPASRSDIDISDKQQQLQSRTSIEYEALVISLALCAANLGSAELFGIWENSMLLAIIQSSNGSLGSRIVVDAWIALASHLLPRSAVLSLVNAVLDVTTREAVVLEQGQRMLLLRLVSGLLAACSEEEQHLLLSSLFEKHHLENSAISRSARICMLVPWHTLLLQDNQQVREIACEITKQLVLYTKGATQSSIQTMNIMMALAALVPSTSASIELQLLVDVGMMLQKTLHQQLSRQVDAANQSIIESALIIASSLTVRCFEAASGILQQIVDRLDNPVFLVAQTGYILARLVGSFADGRIEAAQLNSIAAPMARVFALLLDEQSSWLVGHEACVQALSFATESASPEIAMTLFPENKHEMLVSFIQRNPSVAGQPDKLETMYCSVLDTRLLGTSRMMNMICANGSANRLGSNGSINRASNSRSGETGIVDAVRLLRSELDSALGPLSDSTARTMREELAALSQAINRFLQDI
ncbi:hypothetical protein FB639_000318 [Coemansia asiatica]|nr:hypothetical protein FB639_000318 [Coemansia asiatica]